MESAVAGVCLTESPAGRATGYSCSSLGPCGLGSLGKVTLIPIYTPATMLPVEIGANANVGREVTGGYRRDGRIGH
jgi:hypothetical protein